MNRGRRQTRILQPRRAQSPPATYDAAFPAGVLPAQSLTLMRLGLVTRGEQRYSDARAYPPDSPPSRFLATRLRDMLSFCPVHNFWLYLPGAIGHVQRRVFRLPCVRFLMDWTLSLMPGSPLSISTKSKTMLSRRQLSKRNLQRNP